MGMGSREVAFWPGTLPWCAWPGKLSSQRMWGSGEWGGLCCLPFFSHHLELCVSVVVGSVAEQDN